MTFDRLFVLVPCQGLENFNLDRQEDEAEQLLSAWSVLWHPQLLANARIIPNWMPATTPPMDLSGHLIIVPDCCESSLPDGWLTQAETAGGCVLRNFRCRAEMLAAALARLGGTPADVDPDLAADFLALGYCHFQVEVLTRKLRYTSNLDEAALQAAALAAADAALGGDAAAARRELQSAFDRLHEARDYSQPVELRLLDLTLVASSTIGVSLREELAGAAPRNLLICGAVVEEMAQREPETLEAIKRALAADTAALIGGDYAELPLPLLTPEAIRQNLCRGLAAYTKHLDRRPVYFGRRRFGLTPALPQILERLEFAGAFHCTLDDGRFPVGNQSRMQWEGSDGTTIKALGCLPVDAGRASSFLRLADKLNDAISLDQTGTVVLAHWPGKSSPWYDDLRRIAAYGSVLGKFLTITEYFEQTTLAGQRSHHKPDQYRAPYLKQDVAANGRDPISRWTRYFRRRAALDAWQSLRALAAVCEAKGEGGGGKGENDEFSVATAAAIDDSLNSDNACAALDDRIGDLRDKGLARFAQALVGTTLSTQRGVLAVNPCSFPQQARVPRSSTSAENEIASIDVPAMGFAWVAAGETKPPPPVERRGWFGRRTPQEPPPMAEENVLRNEFFEVLFDPHTGSIRSISDYYSRNPRLAQQIALRLPCDNEPGAERNYSIMAANELKVTSAGPALGEIVSRGRLLDREGRRLAGFQQTTRAWRGSRVLELQIELDIDHQPGQNPWDSYYAARFAWKDGAASLYRSVNMATVATELTQIESPHFLELRRDKLRTTLLCGGLPYHRRFGPRKLDTLLVVRGETARSFRLGIGIDVPNPMAAALAMLAPPLLLSDQPPPRTPSGWLFHLDCRNVFATYWEPLPVAGSAGAFRVRLLETDGCGVQLGLRCFRAVESARKINPGNMPPLHLVIEGDRINIPIGPHQWIEVEVQLKSP
jgi:alpha-mannosidase